MTIIPSTFINYAADTLGETNEGLSGTKIAEFSSAYTVDYSVDIPHPEYPFHDLPNKRTALKENLKAFKPEQQYQIIKDLCELEQFKESKSVRDLRIKLVTRFGYLNSLGNSEINETLVEELCPF